MGQYLDLIRQAEVQGKGNVTVIGGEREEAGGDDSDHFGQGDDRHGKSQDLADASPPLPDHGWALIFSHTLGEPVLWADDEQVTQHLRACPSTEGVMIYTWEELRLLVQAEPTAHDLRMIHTAKTIFGGAVTDCNDTGAKEIVSDEKDSPA